MGLDSLLQEITTMSAKMSQDAKKDEFRKYLEKAGVLELLTKSLVQLYEEPEKPSDGLSYMKKAVGGSPADKELIANLQKENEELKAKVSLLEEKQNKLQETLAELELKQVKEVASIEADAPVEAAEGKTSEEPVASTEDKVVAEPEAVASAEVAPVTNSPSATAATEEAKPAEAVVEASEEAMEAAAEEKPATEEPMETESNPTDPMETKSDPPAAPVAEAEAAPE